jgi:AmiR/NasT family two-component response regulator
VIQPDPGGRGIQACRECVRLQRELAQLRDERDRAQEALAERKVIERAKGVLMREQGLSESDAYHVMRRAAMAGEERLVEVARRILVVSAGPQTQRRRA